MTSLKDSYLSKISVRPITLVNVLVISALTEFLAVRLLARVGSIPRVPWIVSAYQAMLTIGSIALSLAAGLTIVLALLFVRSVSRSQDQHRFLAFALLAMTIATVVTLIEAPSPIFSVAYSVLAIIVLVLLTAHLSVARNHLLRQITQLLIVIGVLSVEYFKLVPQLGYLTGQSLAFAWPLEVYLLGEAATLAATILISANYLMRSGLGVSKKAVLMASLVTVGFVIFFVTNAWILSIIAIWTVGFTMFMPFPIYAATVFLFTYTVADSWSHSNRWLASALLMLFLAGRVTQLGYLSMLMVIGLALLSFPEAFGFQKRTSDKPQQALTL